MPMPPQHWALTAFSIAAATVQALGILLALRAILIARTPQAAIGWSLGLVVLPLIAIPLFLVFGESRFSGYTLAGDGQSPPLDTALQRAQLALAQFRALLDPKYADAARLAERLGHFPPTCGNDVRLLVDGAQTFAAIFSAIDAARDLVIVQFFIIHDDALGKELKKKLLAALDRGVRVWVMYDKVGSKDLPAAYADELRRAGAEVQPFVTNRQLGRRFQINFRNHRKLVICDGHVALIGGLNVGDEYMGRSPRFGPWRDTHLRIEGPAVQALQIPFIEDWHYASGTVLNLPWKEAVSAHPGAKLFTIASGPASSWSPCPAVFLEVIRSAQKRLWIASPYFVPDAPMRTALGHAALRGVDVRILLPQMADHLLPWLSSFTYYSNMRDAGVKIYRYQPGFMHQKVLLADDDLAIIGSINLDYRSFMLNFELAAAVNDTAFAASVERMLEADFACSKAEDMDRFDRANLLFKLKVKLAALMSPEQ